MNETTDGGPAFPCDVFDPDVRGPEQWEGMTLRDYFAAHAPAVPSDYPRERVQSRGWNEPVYVDEPYAAWVARWALEYADAVLKARTQ